MNPIAYRPSRLRRIAQRSLGALGLLAFLSACGISDAQQVTSATPPISAAAPPTRMAEPYPAPYPLPATASSAVASPTSAAVFDSYPAELTSIAAGVPTSPPPYIPPDPPTPTLLPPPPLPLIVTATIDLSILQSPTHAAHHLLFYSAQPSQTGLMLADIEDNTQIWLTKDLAACRPTNEYSYPESVSWSADLRFLAIFCSTRNIQGSFYLLDRQQGVFRAVQPTPGYVLTSAVWSPQGHQLLVEETYNAPPPERREIWYRMDTETQARTKLMEFATSTSAIWTPDGQALLVAGSIFDRSEWQSVVDTMQPDGSQPRRILQQDTGENIFFAGWSADKQTLYFIKRSASPHDSGHSWGLDMKSGTLTAIHGGFMDISPDAHYAIASYQQYLGSTNILISLDRKEDIRQLPAKITATWLNDGRLLIADQDDLAAPQRAGKNNVYISTITGEEHTILSGLSGWTDVVASPDMTLLAVNNSETPQIVIVDINGQQQGALAKNSNMVNLSWFAAAHP